MVVQGIERTQRCLDYEQPDCCRHEFSYSGRMRPQ
jgi:hypothetical protein